MMVIQLTYEHLSDHLKPCLLYLAIYKKDTDIEISELKDLWSAEGLVEQNEMKSVEEILEVYVEELISSSLVIVFNKKSGNLSCQIHDLVHDFCLIKARKEKLFDFTSSSVPLSSDDDLMPRGMTIHYDLKLHWNKNIVLFNPEKKNPYVKHLLSLKVYMPNCLPYNRHLRHLRLLKRLELQKIRLTDTLLNEIGMLVHLKCLKFGTMVEALPPSFSNLLNLETLVVDNPTSNMVLSPSIWSLAKLRRVSMNSCSLDEPTEDSKLENLRILHWLKLSCWEDTEEIFRRLERISFPCLRNYILNCHELMDIPDSFGDIASLKSITVWRSPQLKDSAQKIKEYVTEMTGEDTLELPQQRDEEVEAKKREQEKESARRDRLYNLNRSGTNAGQRKESAVFKSSVDIHPEWNMLDQIQFLTFSKLSFSVPEPEDLLICGGLEFYDR
ncbi:hypothetical protein K7X08_026497 [Anisodus acutangulus]|uniref:Disease resistance protein winged helix domain-containing protein n=1 Tax=Anisodus acutangulus TaxID=402998 RepID=A0A9Q1LN92_9SOLA|nr:hypothetical protein K7X08_026497 [Anisodus acutangulus]